MPVPRAEARRRAAADMALREIIVDDAYGLDFQVLVVEGGPAARLRQVMSNLQGGGA